MSNIEEHLRRAIEEGKLDDLPGKGKPLSLDDDAWVEADWRLAYHLLTSAGYTLPWIETLKEIDAEVAGARQGLRRAWEYRTACLSAGIAAAQAESEYRRAEQAFRQQVDQLNQRIRDSNLQVPSAKFQRRLLNPETEIHLAQTDI